MENLLFLTKGRYGTLVSLRESLAYSRLNLVIPWKLKRGQLVRGSVITKDDHSIKVAVLTKTGSVIAEMSEKDLGITTEDLENIHFVSRQGIVAKVMSTSLLYKLSGKEADVYHQMDTTEV